MLEHVDTKGNWYSRNKLWFLPVAILSVIILMVLLILTGLAMNSGTLKSSTPYEIAGAAIQANQQITNDVGENPHNGWLISGSVEESYLGDWAEFSIPIKGMFGEGTADVYMEDNYEGWQILKLRWTFEGQKSMLIDTPYEWEDEEY